ncbi:hypothetical protein GTP41_12485 [Pseudoduganella sp. DS3]|uniref:Uncharacterized protein n=1 Tax=Pseudoduganella guangdongensis TaxID=2692179 RepID=A0A6N9HH34_9BURK|nr:hypothetical protein [Pseudoduganella guangdongensis]MYN02918.1 hypothetical protein [Pseudoduganella guangdongensis]
MCFADEFSEWVMLAVGSGVPTEVCAFCFNLYDRSDDGLFSVELIGVDEFDADDGDWACSEVWAPVNSRIEIPLAFSGNDWRSCLDEMADLLNQLLASGSAAAQILKSRQAIAVGFVDGDLDVLWLS